MADADSARNLEFLLESAGRVDRAAEPRKWAAYRALYAQAASTVDPVAAIAAYREAIPVWDPREDHEALAACHFGLGSLLFARVAQPADVEEPIPHLEFAADDFPYECGLMLACLYALRQTGDPWENWKKRVHFLEAAIAALPVEQSPEAWADRRNDLAVAWTEEPTGDFAAAMERRIANHLETLSQLHPEQDDGSRRAYLKTCMQLAEAYGARVAGDAAENQASAVYYAGLGSGASTEQMPPDLRAQVLLAWGRALMNEKTGLSPDSRREHLHSALAKFDQAGTLFSRDRLPVLASTVERFRAIACAELARLGEAGRLEDAVVAAQFSYDHLGENGDPSGRRTSMWIAGGALMEAKQFAQAIPFLTRAAEEGERALAQASSRQGRLEKIWELHDSWASLADCYLEAGEITAAVEALDRGKARLWQTAFRPATAAEMQTLVPPGGALLFPVFAGSRGAVAIATEKGWDVAWLENLGAAQLHSLVFGDGAIPNQENLTQLTGWIFLYATRHGNAERWKDLIDRVGDVLYRDLWKPVEQRLEALGIRRGAELVWFPQGASSVLPIHSARHTAPDGLHPITEDYALRYAPSVALLLAASASGPAGSSLLVADPWGDLRYSELELECARQSIGGPASVLAKAAATREAVLARLSGAEIFHFSGHALFRLDDPFQSSLALAPPESLSIEDLQPLLQQSPPRMVVLSACQTAMSQITMRADEALGFPSLLLAHGVRGVIATLWPVDDLATALFIGRFYQLWRAEGQSSAHALGGAQNWLRTSTAEQLSDWLRHWKNASGPAGMLASTARIELFQADPDSRPFAHPMFWAAFVLAGHESP